jgi:hypothetical protein
MGHLPRVHGNQGTWRQGMTYDPLTFQILRDVVRPGPWIRVDATLRPGKDEHKEAAW